MSKELVISANRHETKVAILEDDQLVEVFFQRANEYSLAGSIHKGRVTRVLPGMQSAFVDLGLERDTFLYVSDFFEEGEDVDRVSVTRESRAASGRVVRRCPPRRGAWRQTTRETASGSPADASGEPSVAGAEGIAAEPRSSRRASRRCDRDGTAQGRSRRRRNRGRGFPDSKYASTESRYSRPRPSVGPRPVEAQPPASEFRDERRR